MSELRIIDADGHAGEDVNAIAEDLEPPFGTRKFFFPYGRATADFAARVFSSTPARLRQDYMDAVGIQCAVLYPTLGLSHGLIQEADISTSQNTSEKNQKHQRQILHQYTAFEFLSPVYRQSKGGGTEVSTQSHSPGWDDDFSQTANSPLGSQCGHGRGCRTTG